MDREVIRHELVVAPRVAGGTLRLLVRVPPGTPLQPTRLGRRDCPRLRKYAKVRAYYARLTERMRVFGPNLGMPFTRSMGQGLFGIRARGKEGLGRAFFCTVVGRRIVVLHAHMKKSQKAPQRELQVARRRLARCRDAVRRVIAMKSHDEMVGEWMRDPAFVQEYEGLEQEFALFDELLRARKEAGLTQAEVARRMATQPSVVARLEAGGGRKKHSPSLATLQKYAEAVGCRLEIRMVRLRPDGR